MIINLEDNSKWSFKTKSPNSRVTYNKSLSQIIVITNNNFIEIYDFDSLELLYDLMGGMAL